MGEAAARWAAHQAHLRWYVELPAGLDAGRAFRDVRLGSHEEPDVAQEAGGWKRPGGVGSGIRAADLELLAVAEWRMARVPHHSKGPLRAVAGWRYPDPRCIAVQRANPEALTGRPLAGILVRRIGAAGDLRASLPQHGRCEVASINERRLFPHVGAQRRGALLSNCAEGDDCGGGATWADICNG